mgnify:CR=1 FL=1
MSRHDEIKNAYKSLGGEATFYDGMITCSTLSGKADAGADESGGRDGGTESP